jgi:hypothetical protein
MAMRSLAVALVVVACYRDADPPLMAPTRPLRAEPARPTAPRPPRREPSEWEQMMVKFRDFKDAMCACADRKCIDSVNQEMTQWAQDNAGKLPKDRVPTEEEMKEGQELGREMATCMQHAMAVP